MKKMLLILLTLMFIGCENSPLSADIVCSQDEEGVEECIAECPEGYYFQENEDGELECIDTGSPESLLDDDGTLPEIGALTFVHTFGCTDEEASNYNADASIDDDTCLYDYDAWYVDDEGDNEHNSGEEYDSPFGKSATILTRLKFLLDVGTQELGGIGTITVEVRFAKGQMDGAPDVKSSYKLIANDWSGLLGAFRI